jgi:hypothetical protein
MIQIQRHTPHQILEDSYWIAFDYLKATGELGEPGPATRFLLDHIEGAMMRGEHRRRLLSNRAIDAYKRRKATRALALVS